MNIRALFLLASLGLTLLVPAQAGTHGFCGIDAIGEPGFKTNDQVFALDDTNAWLHRLEHDMPNRPEFGNIVAALLQDFVECQKMECTFCIGKSGSVENLKVYDSSGSKSIDNLVTKFISESAAFNASPNNISWERGLLVEFCKITVADKAQIKVWFHLDPTTRGKHFSIEHYLAADTQHPWKKPASKALKLFNLGPLLR